MRTVTKADYSQKHLLSRLNFKIIKIIKLVYCSRHKNVRNWLVDIKKPITFHANLNTYDTI